MDFNIPSQVKQFATFGDFPTTGAAKTIYIDESTGNLYYWNGSAYSHAAQDATTWGNIGGTLSAQTDLQSALDSKVDKVTGKQLSTNDYTNAEKSKLAGIQDGAEVNVNADWNALSGDAQILNKPDLTTYVPYTGATTDVNLGEHQIKAGQVEFDTTPTGTFGEGKMRWNDTDGTAEIRLKGNQVTLQVGQEQVIRVVNKSGYNLTQANYDAVRVRLVSEGGAAGQRLAVVFAQADSDTDSATTLGMVTEDIADNQEGFITIQGELHDINTTGSLQGETWSDGDVLYLHPSAEGFVTNIKPTAPSHMVVMGYVVYAHAVHGKIYVSTQNGYELEELPNVTSSAITTPNDVDSVLILDNSTSLWKRLTWANIKATLKTYFDTLYQSSLGFTPENVANKSTSVVTDQASNTKYPSVKSVYDWAVGLFTPKTRNITINGTTQDLSADRTWTISGGAAGAQTLVPISQSFGTSTMGTTYAVNCSSITTTPTFANNLILMPYKPYVTFTSTYLAINCTVLGAGVVGRILIYSDAGNGNPGTKLYESTDLLLSSIGLKSVAVAFTFTAGTTYWLAVHTSGAATLTAIPVASLTPIFINGTIFYQAHKSTAYAVGSAPATYVPSSYQNGAMPFINITV